MLGRLNNVLSALDVAGTICTQVRLCLHPTRADVSDHALPALFPVGTQAMPPLHHPLYHCHHCSLLQWHYSMHIL